MKTAVSLPDAVFEAADALAQSLGVSRSRLYATAIERYIADHRTDDVTRRLDAVYSDEPGALDDAVSAMQSHTVRQSGW